MGNMGEHRHCLGGTSLYRGHIETDESNNVANAFSALFADWQRCDGLIPHSQEACRVRRGGVPNIEASHVCDHRRYAMTALSSALEHSTDAMTAGECQR
jgi:hypothetical protein